MFLFKACTRCSGDMQETSDMYGRFRACLNCGHYVYIDGPATTKPIIRGRMHGGPKPKPRCLNCGRKLRGKRARWCEDQCAREFKAKAKREEVTA